MRTLTFIILLSVVSRVSADRSTPTQDKLIQSSVLSQLSPSIKKARPVSLTRNAFGTTEGISPKIVADSSPDRVQQLTLKLAAIFERSLGSVIHRKNTGGVILFGGKVFTQADELYLGTSNQPLPVLPKVRVVLSTIGADSLELTVISLEAQRTEDKVRIPLGQKFTQ